MLKKIFVILIVFSVAGTSILAKEVVGKNERQLSFEKESNSKLDFHLRNIESTAKTGRYIGTGIMMGGAAACVAGAAVSAGSDSEYTRKYGPVVFGITGGIFLGAGLLILFFPTDYELLPREFQKLPSETEEQLNHKVSMGETYLSRLASRSRSERYVGGGILLALGTAELAWWASLKDKTTNNSLIYSGSLFMGFGLLSFFLEKPPESEYREYKSWKQEQEGKSGKDKLALSNVGFFAAGKGLGLGATLLF